MSQYFEIKENKLVMKMEHFHPLHNLPQEDSDENKKTFEVSKKVFENIVRELYLKMKDKEGEWSLEDDKDNIIIVEVESYLEDDEELCEELIRENGGINQSISEFVDDLGWDCLNKENVSGCLAFHILSNIIHEVDNQLWEDVVKAMIEHEDGWELDFEYEW